MTACDPLELEILPPYIGSAVSPTVDITETTTDVTVTITDFQGEHSYTIEKTDQAISNAEQAASNANAAAANATSTANQAAQYARTTADQAAADAQETADEAAGRADTAAESANQAAQAATTAAGTANTAASNADAKAALADTAATNADTATQAANTATTNATNAAQAANNAADAAIEAAETITDGYFPNMLAGAAEALMGDTDTATFAERVSTHDGVARIESVKGNTLVWNQLVYDGNFTSADNWFVSVGATESVSSNKLTVTGETNSYLTVSIVDSHKFTCAANHKYFIAVTASSSAGKINLLPTGLAAGGNIAATGATSETRVSGIITPDSSALWQMAVRFTVTKTGTSETITGTLRDYVCIDLTRMFGAGNEPATVAEFEALFPADYYPYSAGELLSVSIEGVNDRKIPVSTYFTDGMKSAGSIHDELTMGKAVKRVGLRAYQSGDESDATVITDGTSTCYALSTPTETPIDPPLTMTYTVEQGGTEQIVIPTGEQSAAPTLAIVYGLTADGFVDKALSVIAPIEGATASTNYSVNAYLVHDQQLHRVTSAIATGEAITPGSNCVACTVMGEIVRLTA